LSNLGNVEDTVTLTYAGNLWDVSLSETSVILPVAGTAEIIVDVTIPTDAENGEFDAVTITATSSGAVEVSSELTTTAEIPVVYALDLAPATDAGGGAPGGVVSYTLTLSNLGNTEDTVNLAYAGNLWDVSLSETSVILPVAGTAEITVQVTIPADAEDAEFDVVTITATSSGAVEVSSELTTTAVVEVIEYTTWMPLILK
ncbi:MAG TPA: hypothetical protein VLM80_12200, partial [Anaerolineales bacterium]|nr:hypothetical protein [Anaerolineales bacterium]